MTRVLHLNIKKIAFEYCLISIEHKEKVYGVMILKKNMDTVVHIEHIHDIV